jgi:D-alanine-D-alanine ligase
MNKMPMVLLYGLDELSQPFEVEATLRLVESASTALRAHGWQVETVRLVHDLVTPLKPFDPREWIVLNLCEGSPAQDFYYARIAHLLDKLGYTFTGSDRRCLDQTQYKWQMKRLLNDQHVPTPRWAVYDTPDEVDFDVYPAIVKPESEHCSMGITRNSVVLNRAEAREQVARVLAEFKGPALIEEFLDSAEYNVTVWGCDTQGCEISVLGISTMTYDAFDDIHDRLCTFEAKWDPASAAYQRIPAICPAPVSPALKAEIERVAIAAYRAAGCRDYGRVDMRLRGEQPMALDVNANCDVSPDGGFANAAHAAGLSYADMIGRIVQFAMMRRMAALAAVPVSSSAMQMAEGRLHRPIPAVAG